MTDKEALQKAENECRYATYLSEVGANAGIKRIYGNRSEWLTRLVFLAGREIERLDKARAENLNRTPAPTLPESEFVYHVIKFRSKLGVKKWKVRSVRWTSYLSRIKHYGNDGRYFSTKEKAEKVAADLNEKNFDDEDENVGELDYYFGNPVRIQSD